RMSPYVLSGLFTSQVFDADAPVDWITIASVRDLPLTTSLTLEVRFGDTPIPDQPLSGWTAFTQVPESGTISATSRYIQYRANLSTGNRDVTPVLRDVTISYTVGGSHAPVAVNDGPYSTNEDAALR